MTDICLFYADLGKPYLPLIERMVKSAKDVHYEFNTVLMTPTPTKELTALFDMVVETDPVTFENLCFVRGMAMAEWARRTKERTIFVDPDIEFLRYPPFDGADIGLLWRRNIPSMPVNTGVVLAEPGCPKFWTRYSQVLVSLPFDFRGWYCDQLAFAILCGSHHKYDELLEMEDAKVWLMEAKAHCYVPENARRTLWAYHHKGNRKWPGKSGDGKSLLESASSMDSVAAPSLESVPDALRLISAAT